MVRRKSPLRSDKSSLVDLLAADLSERIASGRMRVGDTLPSVVELAAHYAVSPPVVREAVRELSVLGMLDVRHGRPTRVSSPTAQPFAGVLNAAMVLSEQGFRDAIELRFAIEPMIAYTAASRASLADLKKVEKAYHDMERAAGSVKQWVGADFAFHSALAEACGNKLLGNLFEGIRTIIHDTMYIRRVANKNLDTEGALGRHRKILECVMARDAEGARAEMERHARFSPAILEEMAKARPLPRQAVRRRPGDWPARAAE